MRRHRRALPQHARVPLEIGLAAVSATLFLLTLIAPEWIEALTGLEPDGGSGSLELFIAGAFLLAAIVCAAMARRSYRRLATK